MGPNTSTLSKIKTAVEPHWASLFSQLLPAPELRSLQPILVLGNQKTGSTAIARLLAWYGRLSISADIPAVRNANRLQSTAEMERFIKRSHYYFRRDLIKDNSLTFACSALINALPSAQFIYIMRHPVQNIRSILDRLKLPGSPRKLDEISVADGWQHILSNEGLPLQASDYITALALRWKYAASLYSEHEASFVLVRYEDFQRDKAALISDLAYKLGIPHRQDISPYLDKPYQPRGAHRDTDPADFFESRSLGIIERICGPQMQAFDYSSLIETNL